MYMRTCYNFACNALMKLRSQNWIQASSYEEWKGSNGGTNRNNWDGVSFPVPLMSQEFWQLIVYGVDAITRYPEIV